MSYLKFEEGQRSKTGLTRTWYVKDQNDNTIAKIYWYAAWRKYVMDAWNAVFDSECLKEISEFLEKVTQEQRDEWRKRKEGVNVYRSNASLP